MSLDNPQFDDPEERPLHPVRSHRQRDYFVMPTWGWAAIGLACLLAGVLLGWALFRPREEQTPLAPSSPTVIVQVVTATAGPATATPTPSVTLTLTATPEDTATPPPTVTLTHTPAPTATPTPELEIRVGGQVKVGDTGGVNLRLRSGPGTNFITFKIIQEGVVLEVLSGPESADDLTWWRLRDPVGVIGWAAQDWLVPVP